MRSLRIRYSSSSNSRWVSSIARSPRTTSWVSAFSDRSPTRSGAEPRGGSSPQQGAHAREQLLALERLDEVVVGARVQPLDARVERVAGGQDQDRHVVVGAQRARDVEAVELGQAEVEDHEIGHERAAVLQSRGCRRRRRAPHSPPCAASAAVPGRCPHRPRRRGRGVHGRSRSLSLCIGRR